MPSAANLGNRMVAHIAAHHRMLAALPPLASRTLTIAPLQRCHNMAAPTHGVDSKPLYVQLLAGMPQGRADEEQRGVGMRHVAREDRQRWQEMRVLTRELLKDGVSLELFVALVCLHCCNPLAALFRLHPCAIVYATACPDCGDALQVARTDQQEGPAGAPVWTAVAGENATPGAARTVSYELLGPLLHARDGSPSGVSAAMLSLDGSHILAEADAWGVSAGDQVHEYSFQPRKHKGDSTAGTLGAHRCASLHVSLSLFLRLSISFSLSLHLALSRISLEKERETERERARTRASSASCQLIALPVAEARTDRSDHGTTSRDCSPRAQCSAGQSQYAMPSWFAARASCRLCCSVASWRSKMPCRRLHYLHRDVVVLRKAART